MIDDIYCSVISIPTAIFFSWLKIVCLLQLADSSLENESRRIMLQD